MNPKQRTKAVAELEHVFAECPDVNIVVTNDFDDVVTEYLAKRGVSVHYESKRFGGEVVAGKTLNYSIDRRLGTCLVINANAPMFSNWEEPQARMERLFFLSHEKKHVLLNNSRHVALGHEAFFSAPRTAREWMKSLADDVASEYLAESYAISQLLKMNESDLGLPEGVITNYLFDRQNGFKTTLSLYFGSLESFVLESTVRYSNADIDMNELWGCVYLRVRDALNVLALMAAGVHSTPPIAESGSIESILAFTSSLKDTWQEVERHFRLIKDDPTGYEQTLLGLASYFESLFLRLGIRLCDGPRGLVLSLI